MADGHEGRVTQLPTMGPVGSQRRRLVFFVTSGACLVGVLLLFREVLTPFALALILAYVLAPLANALERIPFGKRRLPRWLAVVILYVCLLSGLAAATAFAVPRLIAEGQRLVREAPAIIHSAQEEWLPRIETALAEATSLYAVTAPPPAETEASESAMRVVPIEGGGYEVHLPRHGIDVSPRGEHEFRIHFARPDREAGGNVGGVIADTLRRALRDTENYTGSALRSVQALVTQVIGSIFAFFIMLMLSAYMLITRVQIFAFFRAMVRPERRSRFDDLLTRIDGGLAGVVRGQLLIAAVNGALSGLGFWLADLRYWPILTLVATLLSIIPIFGAIISSVPAVIVGLQDGLGTAAFVFAWIVGIHQIEANLLNPKIMGDAAKVHPVLVVFALLAGEHLYGIVGALLAVPILSIAQSVFLHVREVALGVPKDPLLARQWAEATLDRPSDEEA